MPALEEGNGVKPGVNCSLDTSKDVDYLQTIRYDILNHQRLNACQLDYIQHLHDKEKRELLVIYNNMMEYFIDFIADCFVE